MRRPFHKPNIPSNLNLIFPNSVRGGWLTTGYQVNVFEKRLSEYLGVKHVVGLNSCTAALHLALEAKGFCGQHKFIIPTLTFASTVECGEYVGMQPILIDSEDNGFLFDLNHVEDIVKRDNSIKAIIPMHYGGEAININFLWTLADKYGLFILEDAAHALETVSNNNIKIGNTDHAAAFSFYANKNITTGGEGGALATNNKKLAEKVKKLSLHGMTKDGWNRFENNGSWEYDITELGFKYNLTDYAASFGNWQMDFIDEWQERRKNIVEQYQNGLKEIDGILLPEISKGHANHLYVIKLITEKWRISRNQFIDEMSTLGVGLAVHYKPINQLSYYMNRYDLKQSDYPNANRLYNSIVTLPLYPSMQDSEVDYIVTNISQIYTKHKK
jgi:dTDP-4-amino-4,6-dideoxygalactose transaminase